MFVESTPEAGYVFLKAPKLKKNQCPLQPGVGGGRFFSPELEGISFWFCHRGLFPARHPHETPHSPIFLDLPVEGRRGPAVGRLLKAGFPGNLCCQVQQLTSLIHKEAPFHPPCAVVKRNRKNQEGNLAFCRCSSGKVQTRPDCSQLGNSSRPPEEHFPGRY